MWLFFIIPYFVFNTVSSLLRRVLAKELGKNVRLVNVVFFLVFLLPAAIILSFFFPHNLAVGWLNLILLLGGSLIWPLLVILSLQANKHVDAGVYAVISNLSPIFTLLIALPFLGERFGGWQYLGFGLLIFSGVFIASLQVRKGSKISAEGLLLSFIAAGILGVGTVYERFMLVRVDFGTYLIYGWGSQVLWSIILARKQLRELPLLFSKKSKIRKILFSWGAAKVLTSIAFISALKLSNATMVSASSNFISVVIVISAYFFLKEKQYLGYKLLAAVVGVVGLILIA